MHQTFITDLLILQVFVLSFFGASARALWSGTGNMTFREFIRFISMPIVITIGLLLLTGGSFPFFKIHNKYESWGYSLLTSFFAVEISARIQTFIEQFQNANSTDPNQPSQDPPADKKPSGDKNPPNDNL